MTAVTEDAQRVSPAPVLSRAVLSRPAWVLAVVVSAVIALAACSSNGESVSEAVAWQIPRHCVGIGSAMVYFFAPGSEACSGELGSTVSSVAIARDTIAQGQRSTAGSVVAMHDESSTLTIVVPDEHADSVTVTVDGVEHPVSSFAFDGELVLIAEIDCASCAVSVHSARGVVDLPSETPPSLRLMYREFAGAETGT